MKNPLRYIYIFLCVCFVAAGILISQIDNALTFIKLCVVLVGFIFSFLCASRIRGSFWFYTYITSLFYVDYLKLLLPSLPFGFLPDAFLVVFLMRMFFFERGRIKEISANRNYFFPSAVAAFYLLFNFFEVFNSALPSPLIGAQTFRALFKMVMMYWGVLWVVRSEKSAYFLIKLLAVNALIVFLFAFKQIFLGFWGFELLVRSPGEVRRIYSLSANAAVFSLVLGVGTIYWWLEAVLKRRFFSFFICLAFLAVSSLSLHRAPLFATLLVLFLASLLNVKFIIDLLVANIPKILLLFLIALIGMAAFLTLPLPDKYSMIRKEMLLRFTSAQKGMHEEGLDFRIKQAMPAIDAIRRYPFGGGLGYTQLRFGERFDDSSFFKGLYRSSYSLKLPMGTGDNSFLTVALETGWVGFILFMLVLFYAILTPLAKLFTRPLSLMGRYLVLFSFTVMLLVTASIVTSSIYFLVIVGSFFWLAFALAQVSGNIPES